MDSMKFWVKLNGVEYVKHQILPMFDMFYNSEGNILNEETSFLAC